MVRNWAHLSGRFSRKSFKRYRVWHGTFMCIGRWRLVNTQQVISKYFWSEWKLSHVQVHAFHLACPHLPP